MISFVTDLHDLHTEAQTTTTERAGQDVALSSTLRIMFKSNSRGRLSHSTFGRGSIGRESIARCEIVR